MAQDQEREDIGYRKNGYHVNTKDKIAQRCRSRKNRCSFGGISGRKNHYNTYAEAVAAAQAMLNDEYGAFTPLKRQPSESEAAYFERIIRDEYPEDELLSVGLTGSRLYGLHHEHSDYDFIIVVDGKGKNVQRFIGELDFREYPHDDFRALYAGGMSEVVEVFHGGGVSFKGTKYEHLWDATRLDTLKYMSATSSTSYDSLRIASAKIEDDSTPKTLRVSARSAIMYAKCEHQRLGFDSRLNEAEQTFVWDNVDILHNALRSGREVDSIHAELFDRAAQLYR